MLIRRKTRSVIFAVLAAVVSTRCGVHAPPRLAADVRLEVPPEWATRAPDADVSHDRWWRALGGPTLEALVVEALAQNHDLLAAAARIDAALAEARVAGATFQPQVDARASASRQRQNLTGFPDTVGSGVGDQPLSFLTSSLGLSLNVSWEVDVWRRLHAQAQAAVALAQAQEAEYLATRLSLTGQVAKSWFALTEARLQVDLAQATATSYRETARQAQDRVAAGVQNPSDGYLAVANLAQAEALLHQRRETLEIVSRQLEVLLGRYPRGALRGGESLPQLSGPVPAGVPADVLGRRPDLAAAERRVVATDARFQEARRALYPRLSLSGSSGTTGNVVDRLLDGDFLIWSIAGNLVQPVFQGGRLRAQVDGAEGRRREALETFGTTALNAFAQVEGALVTETFLREREASLLTAATAALEAVRIAENRYGQGVDPLLVVLEAQRRALDTQSGLITVRRRLLENRTDLHLALGGDIP